MSDQVFNVAKGRLIELHERVNNNDPANSALVVMLLRVAEADATLIDYDTFAAILAGSNTEADFTNYARKVLTDSDVAASTTDDTNNRREADFADLTWTSAGGANNDTLVKLIIGYDPDTTGGDDTAIIPMAHYDFAITTNGGDLVAQLNAAGYSRAA